MQNNSLPVSKPLSQHDCGEQTCVSMTDEEQAEYEERMALGRIVNAFREYVNDASWEIKRWEQNYNKLPDRHKQLLPHLPDKFARAKQCAEENYTFVQSMLSVYEDAGANVAPHLALAGDAAKDYVKTHNRNVTAADVEKVRYVFKNLMRDWSEEGAMERSQSYGKICKELRRLLGPPSELYPRSVLVPGAGLARLCCEVASMGYQAQGNEFSYFMLLASSFILNHTSAANMFTVYPWMHSNCNHMADADQLKGIQVPETHPCDLVSGPGLLSMCAGDFVEVYSQESFRNNFDAVVTCFFIDTAHNIVEYMEIIWNVLKDGGYWVNFGPLLYHWADSHLYLPEDEMSVELSLEDVKRIAEQIGFKVLRDETVFASYMSNKSSMLQSRYSCAFWTFVKPTEQQQKKK